jgi:pimeloyl-ACP methyl ester carboxylesterase
MRFALLALPAFAAVVALAVSTVARSAPSGPAYAVRDLALQTADGITIHARLYGADNADAVVYCHRLLGGKDGGEVRLLVSALIDGYDVIAFDFRGHKSSRGTATAGGDEVLDLRAVLSCAKRMGYRRIVVIGARMGGTVGWRTAELFGNMDALIVVSPSGLARETAPFVVGFVSDKMLTTSMGRVPLRIITKTRIGLLNDARYPAQLAELPERVPALVIQSENDRLVHVERLKLAFGGFSESDALLIVPGRRHAEDLIDPATIARMRVFVDSLFHDDEGPPASRRRDIADSTAEYPLDPIRLALSGDSALPERIVLDELGERLGNRRSEVDSALFDAGDLMREISDVYSMHGYTRIALSVADSFSGRTVTVSCPKIRAVSIEGNRWVSDGYLLGIARIGGDDYNAYEIDEALRRLSSEPALQSAKARIVERGDGDVDVFLNIKERRPYRFLLSTKFTDVDKFAGVGFTWNEVNPTALRYEGRAMAGFSKREFLSFHTVSKDLLQNTLRLGATAFDNIKSRDDLDYVFTRQEVHERGGEFAARYRFFPSASLTLGLYGKEYTSSVVSLEMPVEPGTVSGVRCMLDVSGRLPPRRFPRFIWRHTLYCEKAGPGGIGDFSFDTFQANLSCEVKVAVHHAARTTVHAGRQWGGAPPQDEFSLGGMTTLRGYADDSFVGSRVALATQAFYISARGFVGETSVWAPLRCVLYGDAGAAWDAGETFPWDALRMDAGFELDYMEILRAGCVWPAGPTREGSPRVYIGWGMHVY